MIEWNRELGIFIQIFLMTLTLVLLIQKRKNLGRSIGIFICAIAIGVGIEIFNFVMKCFNASFNSVSIYVVGINLLVFLLFFIYFHSLFEIERFKKINLALIGVFLLSYIGFALFTPYFFQSFPFIFYCIEVALLSMSIFLVLWQTFNSDRILKLGSYYPFRICIGLMVIYLGVTPLLIVSNTASKMMNLNIFFIILFAVNVIGYSILLTGIFYAKKMET